MFAKCLSFDLAFARLNRKCLSLARKKLHRRSPNDTREGASVLVLLLSKKAFVQQIFLKRLICLQS